ncbi:MAG: VIT domain-containing protein, partial [Thermodesulfobacteriota bacterium]
MSKYKVGSTLGVGLAVLWLILTAAPPSRAEIPEDQTDRTLSPYFFVKSDDPAVDRLPLKSTSAQVKIAGVIADVTITQVYKNEGRNTLEAIYVFPGSTRAAVYAMRMTVGERVIEAEIMKRE